MIVLPIVERELRAASRRAGTYWSRLAAALVALALLAYLLVVLPGLSAGFTVGATMFRSLAGLAFVYALLAGVHITSDCLSGEKREGTLGLLFLTDLKAHDVVLGKLAATSLNACYGLLAVLPVLAVPILTGGVSAGDFWRTALALVNALFFSLAAGLFVSSVSRVARKAGGGTLLLVLLFTAGLPMAGGLWEMRNGADRVAELLFACSPWFPFALARGFNVRGGTDAFWMSVGLVHAFGWAFLLLACVLLPRIWQDRPAAGKVQRVREISRNVHLGSAAKRKAFRAWALDVNPIFWLASRVRLARTYPWFFLLAMAGIWFWGWSLEHQFGLTLGLMLSFVTHLFFKIWVAGMAAQSFAADRDQGALELLLSTPMTVPELVRGQWLALRHQFARPVLTVLAVDLVLLAAGQWSSRVSSPDRLHWLLMTAANVVVFLADLIAVGWLGMWNGVNHRRTHNATARTLASVLFPPWVGVLLLIFVAGLTRWNSESPTAFVLVWSLLSLFIDLAWMRSAKRALQQRLRTVATQRFSSAPEEKRWWQARGVQS